MGTGKLAILGTPGFVRDPARFDDKTLLSVLGQNAGNLMFQYAATQIISGEKSHIGLSEQGYGSAEAFAGASHLLFPAANHLRAGADWTGLNDFLSRSKVPLIILGLGAQSPKIGGEQETVNQLKADPHVSRMVDILRDKAAFVSVRGSFTQRVCEEMGLKDVSVLGCPSALLSPDIELGQRLGERLAELREAAATPRFGLTAGAPFEIRASPVLTALERKLFHWVRSRGGLYLQQSGGEIVMQLCRKGGEQPTLDQIKPVRDILQPGAELDPFAAYFSRLGRFHISAPEWIDELSGIPFVLGTRVHGNMAAIAGGTLGIVIAHDSRTGELIETMHLPNVTIEAVMDSADMTAVAAKTAFDPNAFDAWRKSVAKSFSAAMSKLGLGVEPHITAIAGDS